MNTSKLFRLSKPYIAFHYNLHINNLLNKYSNHYLNNVALVIVSIVDIPKIGNSVENTLIVKYMEGILCMAFSSHQSKQNTN